MQKQVNTAQKLELLKSIISGGLSFESLRPPETFVIFKKQDLYTVDDTELSEDQFEQWKAIVRECDTIVIFSHDSDIWDNEPELSNDQLQAIYEATKPLVYKHITTEKEPVETLANSLETEPIEDVELFAIPVRKTGGGLLSEYGVTWKLN